MTIPEIVAYFESQSRVNARNHKVLGIGGHKVSVTCVTDFGEHFNLTDSEGSAIDPKFGSRKTKKDPKSGKHIKRCYKVTFNLGENYEAWLRKNENREVGDGSNNGHDKGTWLVNSVLYQYANGNICLQYLTESKAFIQSYSYFVFDNGTKLTDSETEYLKRFVKSKPTNPSPFRNVSLANVNKMVIEGVEVEVIK